MKAGWEELRGIAKGLRTELATKDREIAELKAKTTAGTATDADRTELESLRTERKALLDEVGRQNLSRHPDFINQYVTPKANALARATEVLAYNNKDTAGLDALLAKPLKDFNATVSELTKDMNAADAMTVLDGLRTAQRLAAAEKEALAKSDENLRQIQQRTHEQQQNAFREAATKLRPDFSKREITDQMSEQEKAEAMAYNQSADAIVQTAEKYAFGKQSYADAAHLALKAAGFDHTAKHIIPMMVREITSRNQMIEALTKQVESLRAAKSPSLSGGAAAPEDASAKAATTPKEAHANVEAMARGLFRGR